MFLQGIGGGGFLGKQVWRCFQRWPPDICSSSWGWSWAGTGTGACTLTSKGLWLIGTPLWTDRMTDTHNWQHYLPELAVVYHMYIYSGGSRNFPRGVRQLPKVLLFFNFFAENCMKMKEYWPGGAHPWRPPWIRQWYTMKSVNFISLIPSTGWWGWRCTGPSPRILPLPAETEVTPPLPKVPRKSYRKCRDLRRPRSKSQTKPMAGKQGAGTCTCAVSRWVFWLFWSSATLWEETEERNQWWRHCQFGVI